MLTKTRIALAAALVLGTSSFAMAAGNLDGDNNPIPGARASYAAPAFSAERPVYAQQTPRLVRRHDAKAHPALTRSADAAWFARAQGLTD